MAADDPTTGMVAGVTQGALNYAEEKAKALINRVLNRDLAFIQDSETIELVQSQRQTADWKLLSEYVKNKDLRIIAQMGLSLRELEGQPGEVKKLRDSIVKTFGVSGLHIAEAVQNEVLSTFIAIGIPSSRSSTDLTKRIEKMLNDVDKYIVFISADDDINQRVKELETRIYADVPDTLILYGCKYGAIRKARSIAGKLKKAIKGYIFTATESQFKVIIVISKDAQAVCQNRL